MKQKNSFAVPEELRRGMTTDKADGKVDGNYTDGNADGKIEAKAVRNADGSRYAHRVTSECVVWMAWLTNNITLHPSASFDAARVSSVYKFALLVSRAHAAHRLRKKRAAGPEENCPKTAPGPLMRGKISPSLLSPLHSPSSSFPFLPPESTPLFSFLFSAKKSTN
jgi:hypothetical protein